MGRDAATGKGARAGATEPSLVPARSAGDIETIRALFREYEASIGVDLCFQGFEREVADLPGDYASPTGRLLIARWRGDLAGCVALRPIDDRVCEMKRLYVRAACRGHRVGRRLAEAAIDAAREIGYERMRLDTLPSMREAIALYRELGFAPIAPYRANPVEGVLFFERTL